MTRYNTPMTTQQNQPDEHALSAFNRQDMAVHPSESTATARWATTEEITHHTYDPTQNIWLGSHGKPNEWINTKPLIGYEDDRHMVTIAGSRAGKGRSAIIPVLLEYPQSVFILDPKGENANITAVRRGRGSDYVEGMEQQVAVLDPFGVANLVPADYKAKFNPLEWFPEGDGALYEALTLAESFIVSDSRGGDEHWNESARAVVQAILLHVKTNPYFKDNERDLITFRRLIMEGDSEYKNNRIQQIQKQIIELESPDDPDDINPDTINQELEDLNNQLENAQLKSGFEYLLKAMLKNEAYKGFIKQWAVSFDGIPPNERGSILSTARRNTAFLDGEAMASVLRGKSSFDLAQLRHAENGFSLYVCLPARYLPTHGRWLRAMLSQTLNTFERIGTAPHGQRRCLFVLDEFASLGHLQILEKSAGLIAGYGIKLWFILQDLSQLKKNYRDSWETFIGNAGLLQAFGVSDKTTTDYLSSRLGRIEIQREVITTSEGINTSEGYSKGTGETSGIGEGYAPGTNLEENPQTRLIKTGENEGKSTQEGFSFNTSKSENTSRALNFTQANLMNPDEIASFFTRENALQLVLIQGQRPIALNRDNYDEFDYFLGKYEHSEMSLKDISELNKQRFQTEKDQINSAVDFMEESIKDLQAIEKKNNSLLRKSKLFVIAMAISTAIFLGSIYIASPIVIATIFIIYCILITVLYFLRDNASSEFKNNIIVTKNIFNSEKWKSAYALSHDIVNTNDYDQYDDDEEPE